MLTAIFRNLQTVHNTGRCLCSPRTKRTCDTLRTALVNRQRISHFRWLDVVGVDVVGVDVVDVDVITCAWSDVCRLDLRLNFILKLER